LEVQNIPHGVLMEKGLEVRSTRVQWNVVMVLEDVTPHLAHMVHQEIDTVERLLNALPRGQRIHARAEYWSQELQRLRSHLPQGSSSRSKRGLVDMIGLISRGLFGTATEQEVREIRSKVLENRNSLNGILHVQKQFLSIVNVSHNEMIQNRNAINNLTHSMHELKHWVARILVDINEYVHGIITYNRISEQVLRITQHVDLYEDLVRVQELQRAALETGNLQERLLPRHILEELTTLPEMSGAEVIRPMEFYYMHVRITPLWGGETLGYTVSIPMVDPTVYLGYQLMIFPIPLGNVSATITIIGSGRLAVDPHTGGMFQADNCLGTRPIICPPVPVHRDMEHIGCTEALILGRDITHYCSADVKSFGGPGEQVEMQGPNHLVLITLGSTVTQRCPDKVVKREVVKGTYRISWDPKCMLHTGHWAIPGLTTFETEIKLNSSAWKPLDFKNLDYEEGLLNQIQLGSLTVPDKLDKPQRIPLVSQPVSVVDDEIDFNALMTPVVTKTTLAVGIGLMAMALIGGFGLVLYIRRITMVKKLQNEVLEARGSDEHEEDHATENPRGQLRGLMGYCLNARDLSSKEASARDPPTDT
jgi:hypothetical protein